MSKRICIEWREVWRSGKNGDGGEVHLLSADLACGGLLLMERSTWETRYYSLIATTRHQDIVDFAVAYASDASQPFGARELILDIRLPENIGVVVNQRLRIVITWPAVIPIAA